MSADTTRKRDVARLAHLLRVCAYTATMLATFAPSMDMVRLSELARRVEAIADEMDDLDGDHDVVFDVVARPKRRRDQ